MMLSGLVSMTAGRALLRLASGRQNYMINWLMAAIVQDDGNGGRHIEDGGDED